MPANRVLESAHRCLCVSTAVCLAAVFLSSRVGAASVRSTRPVLPNPAPSALQLDWLAQARLRDAQLAPLTPALDAAGAVDGVKDGKFGFHTGANSQPSWWQVDLGKSHSLGRIVIYNRCDFPSAPTSQPTAKMQLLLSDDGKAFRTVYTHDGHNFYGFTDKKPLVIELNSAAGRFVRVQVPPGTFLHLDELEAYGTENPQVNLALRHPAAQSTISQWSRIHLPDNWLDAGPFHVQQVVDRGRKLAEDLRQQGIAVDATLRELDEIASAAKSVALDSPVARELYLRARAAVRQLALRNPVLDFDSILFVKRAPGTFSHMSDQYYSWWSRPGGGVFIMENIRSGSPRLRCLTGQFPEGSFLSPDLSYDGKRVLFAFCRFVPGRSAMPNKLDKDAQPEDSFYHVFEMDIDGSGLRQLTHGRYDDTFPRYLPNGEIAFLSTRRGQFLQCGKASAAATVSQTLPDSFVRCGGDPSRPVSIYTLHVMDGGGASMRAISAFESFEWDPSVANDGRIYYARWDYVDRDNMPYMKLWATNPDGTNAQIVWGNFTRNPQCAFEARAVPNSRKIIFTAAAHHAVTGGSLVLLDPSAGVDGELPITRLTPETCFPESEGWTIAWYANPCPLSERYYLTAWGSPVQPGCPPQAEWGTTAAPNALGIYLYDAFGNLELLYRDPNISCMYPIPLRPRKSPPAVGGNVDWDGKQEGRILVQNVYEGLGGIAPGTIKRLRIVAMPVKTQPNMDTPHLGVTADDPGKCVLGTVPVEADGSAHFRAPSGVAMFFQALDDRGRAVQTMRSLTYVQPGQTLSCIGCHEARNLTPTSRARPIAAARAPSKLRPGPVGSWPMRYDQLVQPVLDRQCVSCHRADGSDAAAAKLDLSAGKSWERLVRYGRPSLFEVVRGAYARGKSVPATGPAHTSTLLKLLEQENGHYEVKLDRDSFDRLVLWMDTYAQTQGSFSAQQEEELRKFRRRMADLLEE